MKFQNFIKSDNKIEEGIKRPWQGTMLAIIIGIFLIFEISWTSFFIAAGFALSGGSFPELLNASLYAIILVSVFWIPTIFILLGILRGKKWALIIYVLISIVVSLISFSYKLNYGEDTLAMIVIFVTICSLYLVTACWKYPFYKNKLV